LRAVLIDCFHKRCFSLHCGPVLLLWQTGLILCQFSRAAGSLVNQFIKALKQSSHTIARPLAISRLEKVASNSAIASSSERAF
jgi:hypothetical protein